VIVFSNTMFGVSLEWLREWWPLGLVAIGGYLIYSSIRDRRGRRSGSSAGDVAAQ
jgi:hypothetical protein